jgi:hypothetical protein
MPVQVACDLCTHGVMDITNAHMRGDCSCRCHDSLEKAAHDLDIYWRQWLAEQRDRDLDAWHRAEDRYHHLEVSRHHG